ncbi:MAG: type IV pilin protein [Gammaproteobacteria bacterium]
MKHHLTSTRAAGFTLIELLIVLAIIAIIAAIAYPSYQRSVLKSHRSDVEALLSQDSQILERRYTQYFNYKSCGAETCAPLIVTSQNGYYTLTAPPSITSNAYVLTATAQGTQQKDTACQTFTLANTGQKTATSQGGAVNTALCWGH